jgi:hypothetical protein
MRPSPSGPSCTIQLALFLSACSPTPLPAARLTTRTPGRAAHLEAVGRPLIRGRHIEAVMKEQ